MNERMNERMNKPTRPGTNDRGSEWMLSRCVCWSSPQMPVRALGPNSPSNFGKPLQKSLEKEQVCSLRGGNRNSGATLMLRQPPADSCETGPSLHKWGPSQCRWSLCDPVHPAGPRCLLGGSGSVNDFAPGFRWNLCSGRGQLGLQLRGEWGRTGQDEAQQKAQVTTRRPTV